MFGKCFLDSSLDTFDVFLNSLNTNGIHVYELCGERWNFIRVHAESVVHHENMTVCELASTDANGGNADFVGDFFAEFFGNVLENGFEAKSFNKLGRFFNGASFFFGAAFLLEVFCGLR